MNLADLLDWDSPKRVVTKRGVRILRKAAPDNDFWDLWRSHKEAMLELGISVGRDRKTDDWEVCWWDDPDASNEDTEIDLDETNF